jgi:hypothetical protein
MKDIILGLFIAFSYIPRLFEVQYHVYCMSYGYK